MSMLGISLLNEIVSGGNNIHANDILNESKKKVKKSLHQTGQKGESKDGMDISMVMLDEKAGKLEFSGAFNPLYFFDSSANELNIIKADKMPIGVHHRELDSFTRHELEYKKGDSIYLFSDGFIDQFGGLNGDKYSTRKFKEIIKSIANRPAEEQLETLEKDFNQWKGKNDQIDDILILGVVL